MVELIIGNKGTGKTKHLIENVNAAVGIAKGNVVFISNSNTRNMHDIASKVRMIDTSEFDIESYSDLLGFMCGVISGNFDITNIFVDGIFKIVGTDCLDGFEQFVDRLEAISVKFNISFVITVSIDADTAPDYIKKYA